MSPLPTSQPDLQQSPAWRKMMNFYKVLRPGIWLMRLPLLGRLFQRLFIPAGADSNWILPVRQAFLATQTLPPAKTLPLDHKDSDRITVGEPLPTGTRYVLPEELVKQLIFRADGLFALHACPCRTAFHCVAHQRNIGCLFLGPATKSIQDTAGRQLTPEEGLAHFEAALADGLIPTILHIKSDADIFQVQHTRMLAICFCCECCCDVRLLLRHGIQRYWEQYNHRLPGARLVVNQACTRCGKCVAACYGGERVITIGPERAEINELCVGCGRCVPACPEGAITLEFDPNLDILEALMARINERVQITSAQLPNKR